MCTLFGLTKQAYYKQLKTAESSVAKEEIIVGLIRKKELSGNGAVAEIYTRV